ncbi:MAG: hypothetical protein V4726_01285 [Verrucomicrobiota bacterium]
MAFILNALTYSRSARIRCLAGLALLFPPVLPAGDPPAPAPPATAPPDRTRQIQELMETSESLDGVLFRDVVKAATGYAVLPVDAPSPADTALLDHLAKAADALLLRLNDGKSPVRGLRRINEASRSVEDHLRLLLNAGDFTCTLPSTAAGAEQRSGYPDLKIVHVPSGRVTYLDPKLFEGKSRASSLRTFYYEPRALTGKIQSDARHLLLGIAHDGKDGAWTFQSWDLVDLHGFHVRLKAEFQGSNRDLYRRDLLLRRSAEP